MKANIKKLKNKFRAVQLRLGKNKIRVQVFPILLWALLTVWVLAFGLMVIWCFCTAVKSSIDMSFGNSFFPTAQYGGWKLSNFITALGAVQVFVGAELVGFFRMLINSVVLGGGIAVISCAACCLSSYCIAKYNRFRWVSALWFIVLMTNFVPISASLSAQIKLMNDLHLYDTLIGMYLYSGGAFGSMFLIFYASWKGVSWSYAEAAFVDGAGHLRTFIQIMFPMIRTIFGVLLITTFITQWNDYMTPMILIPSMPTIAYGAWQFQFGVGGTTSDITLRLAGLIAVALPIFVLFMCFKDKIMGSLTMGGLKG